MCVLTSSVGQKGLNLPEDVRLVEFLLNRALPEIYPGEFGAQPDGTVKIVLFKPDGHCDDETIQYIKDFQKRVAGFQWPDGRVDPANRTIGALLHHYQQQGGVIRLSKLEMERRIRPQTRARINAPLHLPSEIKAGDFLAGLDGRRLVLSANNREIAFLLLDKNGPGDEFMDLNPMRGQVGAVYAQRTDEFLDEYATLFFRKVAQKLAPIKALMEAEAQLIMGLIAGASIPGFALVLGMTIFQFIMANRGKFAGWTALLKAVLDARADLKRYAPTLYDNLIDALFLTYLQGVVPATPGAAKAKTLSYATGVMLGAIGAQIWKQKLNVVMLILGLLSQIFFGILKSTPDALREAAEDWEEAGPKMAQHLASVGVTVTPQEQIEIFAEMKAHPKEIKATLDKLQKAIKTHAL